jgi:NADPH-ferrihemoprotein reductase
VLCGDMCKTLGEDVAKLIDEDTSFYVCVRAGMARDVVKDAGATMQKAKGRTEGEVNGWSKAVRRKNKWQEDVRARGELLHDLTSCILD